jgi:hypothetical protein
MILMLSDMQAQWIEPYQLRPAPDSSYVIGATAPYGDADWVKWRYLDSLYGIGRSDSIYLQNDTIFLRDGSGYAKVVGTGGGGYIHDLYPYLTGFVLDNPTNALQDTVIFEYTNSIVSTPPGLCDCTVGDVDGLSTALSGKADLQHLHSITDVVGLLGALDGKEAAFSKGSIIQGDNVTLTGNLSNRLVGSGDITIAATGGGGSVTIQESTGGNVNLSTSNATLASMSLVAGTWKIDGVMTLTELQAVGKTVTFELFNSTAGGSALATFTQFVNNGEDTNVSITKRVVLSSTSTIIIRARTSNGTALVTSTVMNAIK